MSEQTDTMGEPLSPGPEPSANGHVAVISLVREERKVPIADPNGGPNREWVLREMTGTQRDAWLQQMQGRVRMEGNTVTGVTNVTGIQASLIACCLFDETGRPVPVSVIKEFPAKAQNQLFQICQELNGLTEASREGLKKA